jgi:hypothetical protein
MKHQNFQKGQHVINHYVVYTTSENDFKITHKIKNQLTNFIIHGSKRPPKDLPI